MDFDALEGYGVERGVIQAWKSSLGSRLLPVQERAVRAGLLVGRNLIAFAPTSSGKTAIGEMAAVKAAFDGRRVFYLVPLKALAEEKYNEFRSRYQALGIDVVVTTRDRAECDDHILGERYRLAVATFEKLAALLTSKPSILESVGLVVVDELQMISDPERGGTLELLLTKLRSAARPPQIVGLSAVLERSESLAAWLGAQIVSETSRPVELRKGVLLNGQLHYVEHNTSATGVEKLFDWPTDAPTGRDSRLEAAYLAVRQLAEKLRELTIVFVPDRRGAVHHARRCSALLELPSASEALGELGELEDCEAREALGELLANGVAFHHADLPTAYRELVELHFRSGGIRVLFATSTLAMGVNLPAKNVLIFPERWRRSPRYGWVSEPISRMEFENLAGRAARLGFGDAFGRAILPEASPFEKDLLFERYLRSPFEPLEPALRHSALDEHLLALFASGLVATEEELARFLNTTFSGAGLVDRARDALDRLVAGSLMELSPGTLRVTDLGRAVAARGIRTATGVALAQWAQLHVGPADIEILLALARSSDAEELHVPLSRIEHLEHKYEALLSRKMPSHPLLAGDQAMSFEETQAVKKALILIDWIEERPLKEIEKTHSVWSGTVERLGEDIAWLAEALIPIAAFGKWDGAGQERLRTLARRLRVGVRADLLPIERARIPTVGRASLRRLLDAGMDSLDALRAASPDRLREILTRRAGEALHNHLHGTVPRPMTAWRKPSARAARILLVGECRSHARATIEVDRKEQLISRRHFELLFALSKQEWLPLADIGGDPDTARKEILRLRRRLAKMLQIPPQEVLRTDGQKRYTLTVSIRRDERALKKHQPGLLATSRP